MSIVAKEILIYRLGSLGDTVMALPCFHKVREYFPDATITLLTNRPVAAKAAPIEAILGSTNFFDRVLDYPTGTRNPLVLAKLIKQIRAHNIDTVINLAAIRSKISVKRDRWFFRAAGIKQQIGFISSENDYELNSILEGNDLEWEANRLVRRLYELGPIDLSADRSWDLKLTTAELEEAKRVLSNLTSTSSIIAISLGTKLQVSNWEIDNWLNLLSQLKVTLFGWKLVVIGASEEASLADLCLRAWDQQGVNLCGKTSPRVSAAVLKQASIFVGHDSGPMHLAACVGVPCVAIFSARVLPRRWYPRGNSNHILYHRTDCAGCGLDVCIEQKKKCILSIKVDEVHQAIMQTLNYLKN